MNDHSDLSFVQPNVINGMGDGMIIPIPFSRVENGPLLYVEWKTRRVIPLCVFDSLCKRTIHMMYTCSSILHAGRAPDSRFNDMNRPVRFGFKTRSCRILWMLFPRPDGVDLDDRRDEKKRDRDDVLSVAHIYVCTYERYVDL